MMMQGNPLMHQPIILLKEGTEASQGKDLIIRNIQACEQLVETVKSTLGPCGQDKLLGTGQGRVTITNDGATIMDLLQVVHPAGKILVDISQSQDGEVGDGTTSVVILAGELLQEARGFVEDGVNPQLVVSGYRRACRMALEHMDRLKIDLAGCTPAERAATIQRCAETSLNSKLLSGHKEYFGKMVYDAVSRMDSAVMQKDMIGVKKVPGGSITDSFWVDGVAFKKTFSYAGFEAAPKKFADPKILLLHIELELKAEKENAELRIDNVKDYQAMIDAEWQIIFDKLDAIVATGANVVLSRLAIGDLATQYFADRSIFCAGRVEDADMKRLTKATGSRILTTLSSVDKDRDLGTCGVFEEKQVGNERYNLFRRCPKTGASTIVLRGGAMHFISEAERSLNDSIMTCCRAMQTSKVVGGGGSIEMEISAFLREQAKAVPGKQQLVIMAFAKALEVIPKTLAQNAGLDPIDILNKLRQLHNRKQDQYKWFGVDCSGIEGNEGVMDAVANYIWEPVLVRYNAFIAATEAACSILSIDEMVKNPKSNPDPKNARGKVTKY